ncbi:regulatory protein RecX [Paenibacillus septentrionalis]|uniref:Regulatory protein RecX n=1 Tax=Paenibacillus septentrionalis TaxID=429342 RepID=A0ABW1V0W5_9BACL
MSSEHELRITSVKVDRKQSKLYLVTVESIPEPLIVHEDLFISYRLVKGRGLTSSLVDEIREESAKYLAYIKGIKYLAPKARSSQQVAQYLRRQEISEPNIAAAVARLIEEGYIDDLSFAKLYVQSKLNRQGKGRLRIAQELKAIGIAQQHIAEVLQHVDDDQELEAAYEAALKKLRSLRGDKLERGRKIMQFLLRRGYSGAISRKVVQRIEKDDKNSLEVDIYGELLDN